MAADQPDEYRIDDPEELSQKKRINELLSRRQAVLDARDTAIDEAVLGQASEEQAIQHYQSRIESLILDLWTKFESKTIEGSESKGREYLEEVLIDEVMVPPPAELLPDSQNDLAAGADPPEPKTVEIQGLEWFIENEPVVSETFTTYSWNPPGEQTAANTRTIPFKTLDKALVYCLKFMDETGIDADFEKEEQQTKIDRELLEEVEEWRQKNVE